MSLQSTETETHVRIGIGIMIVKDGTVLLGKRIGSHGAGEYAFPGGYVEYVKRFNTYEDAPH